MDSTSIYWMNGEASTAAVVKVPLAGGTVTTLASAPVGSYADSVVGALAVDATFVYWVARDAVMRVPIEGGTPTMRISLVRDRPFHSIVITRFASS